MIPTIITERLVLRPFELQDAPEVKCLAGDRAIADTTLNIPHPYLNGMAEEWISKHQEQFAKGQGLTLAVTRKIDGTFIGAISLMNILATRCKLLPRRSSHTWILKKFIW
ncbi:MAG: GNAT family N-acetyltransferase [Deltaproteobacteria bacterium]|nr:GNAT family N-acetyltransferase [Deltaproteobacteria bacterium]